MIYSIGTNIWDSDMDRLLSVGVNSNKAIVDDAQISELLLKGASCNDPAERAEYYKEVQVINNEQMYYIPLYYCSAQIAYTKGLEGTPNELKLKYLADNDFKDLSGDELKKAISERIKEKGEESLVGNMASQGTTPRKFTDLIGSLCDLTSGSGDKGTPVVLVQGYFDNYTN